MTCRGTDEGIALLLWQTNGYSYALHFSPAVDEDTALAFVGALI